MSAGSRRLKNLPLFLRREHEWETAPVAWTLPRENDCPNRIGSSCFSSSSHQGQQTVFPVEKVHRTLPRPSPPDVRASLIVSFGSATTAAGSVSQSKVFVHFGHRTLGQ